MNNQVEGFDPDHESEDEHMVDEATTGRGYLTGPGISELPVNYAVVNGHAYCEGCIDLGPENEVVAEARRIDSRRQLNREFEASDGVYTEPDDKEVEGVGITPDSSFLWTNGVMAYEIDSSLPDQARVVDAIKHIEDNTAIRFIKRTSANASSQPNYVQIISNGNESWSSSKIGMRGGKQLIKFSDRHSWKILVHEFGHALGLYHEQSRSDRDDYVEIKWSNIPDGPPPEGEKDWTGNFKMKSSAADYHDYDYDSIMHYGPKSFARDRSKPTIVPLRPGVTIGQREGLSYGDRLALAKMYRRYFTQGYAGVWRQGTGRYAIWVNASWTSFESKWKEWSAQGLRLQDIHVRRVGSKTRYSGIFRPGSGKHALWTNVSWTSFKEKWQQWSAEGLRLVDIHVHRSGGSNRYSGVFHQGSGAHGLWVNASWSGFKSKREELNSKGLRLHDIHVHRVGDKNRYTGVFLPGSGAHGLWVNASWSSFHSKWKEWSGQGLRLVDLNLHKVDGSVRYSGAFLKGNDSYALWANVTYQSLKAKWQQLSEKNMRLVDFEFINTGDDAADQTDFSLADGSNEFTPESLEEFGGLFDPDDGQTIPVADTGQHKVNAHDGGGGVIDSGFEDASIEPGSSDGGAFYPDAASGFVGEMNGDDAGFGSAVFDTSQSQLATVIRKDSKGNGSALLPEDYLA